MVRGNEHQGTGVDEPCNQVHLEKMVVPLLCKRFKQRNERHLIEHFGCRLKELGYGDPGITLIPKLWGEATRHLAFKTGSD